MPRKAMGLADRFWSKVAFTQSGCWEWESYKNKGYGVYTIKRNGRTKNYQAHRLAYAHLYGNIPAGLEIDHICRNTACVNPNHLEPVDHRTNLLRGTGIAAMNAKATHCPSGHEYSGDNLYLDKQGWRECRICRKALGRAIKETEEFKRKRRERYAMKKLQQKGRNG